MNQPFDNVMTLSEKSIIDGTMLGDGTLQKRGENSYRLRVSHCAAQREYVEWKHKNLCNLCTNNKPPHEVVHRKKYVQWQFYLNSGLYLRETHKAFYVRENGASGKTCYVKRITPELLGYLSKEPTVMAVFFMDDGSVRDDAYSGRLATHCFTKPEQELFRDYVDTTHGIKLEFNRQDNYDLLVIPASQFGKFVELIKPTVDQIPCMRYKLNESRRSKSIYLE